MSKQINNLNNSLEEQLHLNEKQDKTDNNLETKDKTIIGAINEIQNSYATAEYVDVNLKKTSGDLTNLQTNNKTNLVGAINELFQDVDSGKELIATAIDDSNITKNSTFDAMGTAITLLHNQITSLTNELAGKVTPVGTAVAGDVLSGKTFINSTGSTITGTMANKGAKTFTPSASKQTGAAGYYSSVTCNAVSNLTAANIKSGVTVGGVTGTCIAAPTSMLGSWYHTGLMYRTTTKPKTTTITHNKGNTNYSIVISSYGQMHSSSSSYNYLSSNSFVDGSTTTTTITFNNTTATYTITVTKNANTIDLSFKTTAGYGVDVHVFIGIL